MDLFELKDYSQDEWQETQAYEVCRDASTFDVDDYNHISAEDRDGWYACLEYGC